MCDTMKITNLWLLFTIALCNGIREDYFLDNEEPNQEEIIENKSVPNPTPKEQLLKPVLRSNTLTTVEYVTSHTNKSIRNISEEYEDTDTDDNKSNIIGGERIFRSEYIDKEYADEELTEKVPNISKINTFKDILKDYVYLYDEPVTARKILRDPDAEFQTDLRFNDTTEGNISKLEDETTEKLLIDFYNLHSVNSILNAEDNVSDEFSYFDIHKYVNNSVWYVPENLPCWDLPILYAELGERKKKGVFLTFSGKLKNVVEKYDEVKFSYRKFNIPLSQTLNKWCAAEPCFGDHTLCLFADSTHSKLCVENYEVFIPTMVERIGLENTVNSMRNRIASGVTDLYKHLPTATDMKQMIYDFDLQAMAEAWLRQCLPGPSACASLDGNYVAQLECTKYVEHCCTKSYRKEMGPKCIPQRDCFIEPIIGCIHTWFRSAVHELTATDIQCGHITATTFNTVQLIWAETNKIGCAYSRSPWGDVRVVCNFAPSAPFSITTKSFCGFLYHKPMMELVNESISNSRFLAHFGIHMRKIDASDSTDSMFKMDTYNNSIRFSDVDILSKIYARRWVRKQLNGYGNGTIGLVARLVTKYTFGEDSGLQCDTSRNIYEPGETGSMCVEKGRRFHGLCYDFRDPTPGYRTVAVLAPIALFTLILYDLFSGVVRQTNY